tara:strand:+ start:5339 stop:7783 length:2445 start_codon:yes stop_codon:yes gene_type:complete
MDKKDLQKYLDNSNVKWVLYNILESESGKVGGKINTGGYNESGANAKGEHSSAYGSQQFIGATRNTILKDYDIDAWADNLSEQQLASIALMDSNGDLESVAKGDFSGLNSNNYWEAFTKDFSKLTGPKPKDWEATYTDLQSNSVHDPAASWAKVPDAAKEGKKGLFESKYGGMPNGVDPEIKPLSKEHQQVANDLNDSKKLRELYEASKNAITPVGDKDSFRQKIDNISKAFAHDLDKGKIIKRSIDNEIDDDKARDAYFKKMNETFGWDNVDALDLDALAIARGQMSEFFEYTKGEEYGKKIGGNKWWDSVFEDMAEDSNYTLMNFSKSTKLPPLGVAPDEIIGEIEENPLLSSMVTNVMVKQGSFASPKKGFVYDESKIDGYLSNMAPDLRAQFASGEKSLDEIVGELSARATETSIVRGSQDDNQSKANWETQSLVDSEFFPEVTSLLDTSPTVVGTDKTEVTNETEEIPGTESKGNTKVTDTTKNTASGDPADPLIKEYEESLLDKMGGLSSLIGLATGAIGLSKAMKEVDIPKDPKLGPAFQQRLEESKRMAQQGLTPSELAKAHNDLDSSYATGIENIVRGSAGNRAQFLAGLGGLDVARQSALMDISVADAKMRRDNQGTYDDMMMINEKHEVSRESKYKEAKYESDLANKSSASAMAGAGLTMLSESIGDRHLNQLRKMQTKKMMEDMGYTEPVKGKDESVDKEGLLDQATGLFQKLKERRKTKSGLIEKSSEITNNGDVGINLDSKNVLPFENGMANMPAIDLLGNPNNEDEAFNLQFPFGGFDLSGGKEKRSGLINPDNTLFEY